MRNAVTSLVVSRSLMLGFMTLLGSGCGVPDATETDAIFDVQVQHSALAPDQCAPPPAAQTPYGGLVYHRYSSGKTWAAAQADCVAMGGQLAVPFSAGSNAAVFSLMGSNLMYIGLNQASGQSSTSAGWRLPNGSAASYFNWSTGEPNDLDNIENDAQNCGRMWTTGYWDDVACSQVSEYACEFPGAPLQCAGGSSCQLGTDSNYHCTCPAGQHYDVQRNACVNGP